MHEKTAVRMDELEANARTNRARPGGHSKPRRKPGTETLDFAIRTDAVWLVTPVFQTGRLPMPIAMIDSVVSKIRIVENQEPGGLLG